MTYSTSLNAGSRSAGNVLFLILIAVALFAALSYAVTQATRSGGSGPGDDKMRLALSEVENMVIAHRTAVQRMVMSGIPVENIDASYITADTNYYPYTNSNCTNDACRIYLPSGGGVSFYNFAQHHRELALWPDDYEPVPSGATKEGITWTWWSNQGTFAPDLIFSIGVTRSFCEYINRQHGITAALDGGHPREVSQGFLYGLTAPMYTGIGTYDHLYSLTSSDQADHLSGQTEGCFKVNGVEEYHYVALLYAT